MTSMTEKIKSSFNKAAPSYNKFDFIQKIIGIKLISQLPNKFFNRVIDLGCGTGWTTRTLVEQIQFHHCEAIDIAELMIVEAKKLHLKGKIQFNTGSFDHLLEDNYDLIFSNLALHWSTDFTATLASIYTALKTGGCFAFSIPLPGTFNELHRNFSVRNFISSRKISDTLIKFKFRIVQSGVFHESLTFDSTLETLRALKKTGATICQKSRLSFKKNKILIKENLVHQLSYCIGTYIVEKHE